jgi:hypothetical protein
MTEHYHSDLIAFLFAGVSAVLFINLLRLVCAPIATRDDVLGSIGRSAGALVHFGA